MSRSYLSSGSRGANSSLIHDEFAETKMGSELKMGPPFILSIRRRSVESCANEGDVERRAGETESTYGNGTTGIEEAGISERVVDGEEYIGAGDEGYTGGWGGYIIPWRYRPPS